MRRALFILLSMIPMMLVAKDYLSIRNGMPSMPTAEQMVSATSVKQLKVAYQKAAEACESERQRVEQLKSNPADSLFEINDQDQYAIDRMQEIKAISEEEDEYLSEMPTRPHLYGDEDTTNLVDKEPYINRINVIYTELNNRNERSKQNGEAEDEEIVAEYTNRYINRINAIVDEYNLASASAWQAQLTPLINECEQHMAVPLTLYKESNDLRENLDDESAKAFVVELMPNNAYSYMMIYIQLMRELLNFPRMNHHEVP